MLKDTPKAMIRAKKKPDHNANKVLRSHNLRHGSTLFAFLLLMSGSWCMVINGALLGTSLDR